MRRLTATNKALRSHGIAPLLLELDEVPLDTGLREAARGVGLSEIETLAVRGTFGTVLGVRVDQKAFQFMRAKCRLSKKHVHVKGDAEASRLYLTEVLRRYCARRCHRTATSARVGRGQQPMAMVRR